MDLSVSPVTYKRAVVNRNNNPKEEPQVSFGKVKVNANNLQSNIGVIGMLTLVALALYGIIKYAPDEIRSWKSRHTHQTEMVNTPQDPILATTLQE